ncbi:MAG: hypothetical protein C4576_14410 [Desulfobacteraceae bacterium]|nr:MAG: hypothetical protein C4576_14410 [Desulfobacteraceae bacterium]
MLLPTEIERGRGSCLFPLGFDTPNRIPYILPIAFVFFTLQRRIMMTVLFSARDVAEAAVEKEKKRKEFYTRVHELSTEREMKELFQFLMKEEEKHVAVFTKIRDNLPTEAAQSEEYTADMQAYMDSIVDDRLYSDMDSREFVQKAVSGKDVYRLAIGFEKDAILYFTEFLPYLTEKDRTVVAGLIEEEKRHIRMLSERKRKM